MYRTQKQHSDDCEKYPFKQIPESIFLDTNIINLIVKYSEQIFDFVEIPEDLDVTSIQDVEALTYIFRVGARANWDIRASRKTLDELYQTPNLNIRNRFIDYAMQLVELVSEDSIYAESLGRQLIDAPFTLALKDLDDRELIGNAIGLGCDVFCTCDRRTIVSKRHFLKQLPIRILTPDEWWAHIRPWAALWC